VLEDFNFGNQLVRSLVQWLHARRFERKEGSRQGIA
jgi:hypothetical protein